MVAVQIHFEHLELHELRQGRGQARCAVRAWEAQEGWRGDLRLSGLVQPGLLWYTVNHTYMKHIEYIVQDCF